MSQVSDGPSKVIKQRKQRCDNHCKLTKLDEAEPVPKGGFCEHQTTDLVSHRKPHPGVQAGIPFLLPLQDTAVLGGEKNIGHQLRKSWGEF